MKTAISIPDHIFQQAEMAARKLGMSRSEFYAKAVCQFVQDIHEDNVTHALDELYEKEPSSLDEGLEMMQRRSVFREEW